jgi:hypothetical protein
VHFQFRVFNDTLLSEAFIDSLPNDGEQLKYFMGFERLKSAVFKTKLQIALLIYNIKLQILKGKIYRIVNMSSDIIRLMDILWEVRVVPVA